MSNMYFKKIRFIYFVLYTSYNIYFIVFCEFLRLTRTYSVNIAHYLLDKIKYKYTEFRSI